MEVVFTILGWINDMHDVVLRVFSKMGIAVSDKELHFYVIGGFGILLYGIVHQVFRRLARISIHFITFIFTLTVLVFVVGLLELQQKLLGRGIMDYQDAIAGLLGFLFMLAIVLGCYAVYRGARWLLARHKEQTEGEDDV